MRRCFRFLNGGDSVLRDGLVVFAFHLGQGRESRGGEQQKEGGGDVITGFQEVSLQMGNSTWAEFERTVVDQTWPAISRSSAQLR